MGFYTFIFNLNWIQYWSEFQCLLFAHLLRWSTKNKQTKHNTDSEQSKKFTAILTDTQWITTDTLDWCIIKKISQNGQCYGLCPLQKPDELKKTLFSVSEQVSSLLTVSGSYTDLTLTVNTCHLHPCTGWVACKNSVCCSMCTYIYKNILDFIKQACTTTCLPIGLCTNKTRQVSCWKPNKHGYTTVQTTAIHAKMDTNLFSAHQDKWKYLLRT